VSDVRDEEGKIGGIDEQSARLAFEAMGDIEIPDPEEWSPPNVLPPRWCVEMVGHDNSCRYINYTQKLLAIVSCSRENDGHFWIHLSVSHRDRQPNWQELAETKAVFLGDREGYTVHPPKRRYVNLHPNVLHVFARLDDSAVLPDFTKGTGVL
jgi:hypothetical protein